MLENNFASIGKSVLIHAIGMQDNHKIIRELDRKGSGCFSCPYFRLSLKNPSCQKCSQCTARKYKNDSYVNEKNRYGFQPSLTMCSIKLFTYLHFFVTGQGVVENLSIRTAAKRLYMSYRSVHNSLNLLKEHGYIEYQKNRPGSYLILLNNYQDYFKKASEGGRGYIVLSREFFEKAIASSEGINELRLHFRMYLNVDDKKYYPVKPETYLTDSKDITDICRYFPHYMKPVHIRKLITKQSAVFTISQSDDRIVYSLNQDYYGELQKNEYRGECSAKLEECFKNINQSLYSIFEESASLSEVPVFLTTHVVNAKVTGKTFYLDPTDQDLDDLLQLSVQYGYECMTKHLEHLFLNTKDLSSLKEHYGEYTRYLIEQELCAA